MTISIKKKHSFRTKSRKHISKSRKNISKSRKNISKSRKHISKSRKHISKGGANNTVEQNTLVKPVSNNTVVNPVSNNIKKNKSGLGKIVTGVKSAFSTGKQFFINRQEKQKADQMAKEQDKMLKEKAYAEEKAIANAKRERIKQEYRNFEEDEKNAKAIFATLSGNNSTIKSDLELEKAWCDHIKYSIEDMNDYEFRKHYMGYCNKNQDKDSYIKKVLPIIQTYLATNKNNGQQ